MSAPVRASDEPTLSALRRLAITGAGWTLLSFGAQSALRLGSNLVLTRLLFPEAFGLMTLVTVTLEALELFSDVGLRQNIVSNPRGSEPHFLHTVWTVQIVRGVVLGALTLVFAIPVSRFYGEPALAGLLALASLTAPLRGLTSASVHLLARQLALRRILVVELGVQVISLVGMALYAWFYPTLWVLPVGTVVARALYCVASHTVMPGPRMRLSWDAEVRRELMGFGRWILVSSVLGYFVNSLDRIALGHTMSMAEFGAYSVAVTAVRIPLLVARRLRNEVMYPVIVRMGQEPAASSRQALVRARLGILAATHPLLLVLAVFGPELVNLLYDERYAGAGWMLQILAAGCLVTNTLEPTDSVLLANRDSYQLMQLLIVRASVLALGMAGGAWAYGSTGVIVAAAFADGVAYPAFARAARRYGAWVPALDALAAFGALLCVGIGIWLKRL